MVLSGLYSFVISAANGDDGAILKWANILGPILFVCIIVSLFFRTLRKQALLFWTPYGLFLAHSVLFYGVGPLFFHFGSPESVEQFQSGYLQLSEFELLRTNNLNVVGTIFVLLGIYAATKFKGIGGSLKKLARNKILSVKPEVVAGSFLVFGLSLKYFVVLPAAFGVIDVVVPGILTSLPLAELGLFVASFLAAKRKGIWLLLLWTFLPINMFIAVLTFSKKSVVLTLLFPALGAFLYHRKILRLCTWVVVIGLIFYVLQPIVHAGRYQIAENTGTIYRASLPERFVILDSTLQEGASESVGTNSSFQRLSYSGPQAFAMRLYDSGRPGDTLRSAWVVFVPRAIWPNKPVGIGPGQMFYNLASGGTGTHLGLTVYGDAYWNFGWAGVACLSSLMGLTFGIMSRLSIRWLAAGAFAYLPAIGLSMQMAMSGPTKFFINGVLGVIPIYIFYLLATGMIIRFLKRGSFNSAGATGIP